MAIDSKLLPFLSQREIWQSRAGTTLMALSAIAALGAVAFGFAYEWPRWAAPTAITAVVGFVVGAFLARTAINR